MRRWRSLWGKVDLTLSHQLLLHVSACIQTTEAEADPSASQTHRRVGLHKLAQLLAQRLEDALWRAAVHYHLQQEAVQH